MTEGIFAKPCWYVTNKALRKGLEIGNDKLPKGKNPKLTYGIIRNLILSFNIIGDCKLKIYMLNKFDHTNWT